MKIKYRELHRVGSTAIIYKNGKYLIVQRNKDRIAFPGKWTVPGGGLEVDDYINLPKTTNGSPQWYFAIENSLKREIKEEVNLEIEKPRYFCDLAFIRPDGIPAVVLSYFAKLKQGKVKLNEENIDYEWITAKKAKKYDLIEGIADEIEAVDKILKKETKQKVA